jgi:type IV pilus assembly protein PilN
VQVNNLRYLSNAELNSAELDREAFAQPAIAFEVASELVTVVGENGTEVRVEAGPPTESARSGAGDAYQATVDRRGAER